MFGTILDALAEITFTRSIRMIYKMRIPRALYFSIGVIASLIVPILSQPNANASDYPLFRDGKLTIPRVDTDAQLGNFQNAEFQYDHSTNRWKLNHFVETKIAPGPVTYEEKVEAIVVDTSPVQVFLKITGQFSDGCTFFQQINQVLKDHTFEIILHVGPNPIPPDIACTMALVPYEKIIPLEVYGLSAGTYEYIVNGTHTGTFTLSKDNSL